MKNVLLAISFQIILHLFIQYAPEKKLHLHLKMTYNIYKIVRKKSSIIDFIGEYTDRT